MQENTEQEINLQELVVTLIKKWYVIAAAFFIVVAAVGIYAYGVMDDTYTSSGSMIVRGDLTEEYDSGDFAFGQRLVDTYTEFARSNTVLDEVTARLEAEYTNDQLREMINIQGVADTIIIRLQVEASDPEEAALVANTVINVMESEVSFIEGLDNIERLDSATVPTNPSGPNRPLFIAVGAILGLMTGVFMVFVIEFFDKTIKTTKDIEQLLGIRPLGAIPDYDMTGRND